MTGVFVVLLCHLLLVNNGAQGRNILSEKDDLKSEQQLKLLNKQSTTIIETEYGELYDCVDFYKQSAFDHPLLKNHTFNFQMKPQFANRMEDNFSADSTESFKVGLRAGGCPTGTVPIKRITKEDLIREKLVAERLSTGGVHYAVVQAKNGIFTGVEGYISIYAPSAEGQQYSAGRMKIQNGQTGNEFIAFGWRVDPTLYGDTLSHLYIQTNTNSARCFDAQCGFVVVAKDVAPGMPFNRVSDRGKTTIQTRLSVAKGKDGNWWLEIGEGRQIGFWPRNLFQEISDSGTFVDWGGEVFSPPNTAGPPMGSGILPINDTLNDAFIRRISVRDPSGTPFDPFTAEFADDAANYDVQDIRTSEDLFGHLVLFGGGP